MSEKRYVPQGVYLVCDKGVKPSELKGLSHCNATLFGEHLCTKVDKVIVANFAPFGACSCVNGSPCTAPVLNWTNVSDGITLGGNELLLENSELPCSLGGKIKIFYSLQDALAACPKPKKGFWETIQSIHNKYQEFKEGVALGLWKGLKGLVTGAVDLVVWSGKHHVIYQLANPKGYAEQLVKDTETAKALGNLAKKGGTWVYRNSNVNLALNPADYHQAQAENMVMAEKLYEKAKDMSPKEWGVLTGQVGFEIVQDVATAGLGAYVTGLKVVDKTVDVAKVVNKLDNAVDTGKALDKIEDVGDVSKGLDELGDMVKKTEDVIPDPPGTYRDPNGQLKDSKTHRYVKDPKTVNFNRSMAERKNALLRDAFDDTNDLSKRAKQQIKDSNGNKVPKGHEVDHIEPLYTAKTKMGKKELDIAENMKTMRKSDHKKLHKKCNKVKYHKYPPNKY